MMKLKYMNYVHFSKRNFLKNDFKDSIPLSTPQNGETRSNNSPATASELFGCVLGFWGVGG